MGTRVRIDRLLVERGLVSSREQGVRVLLAGEVVVDGARVDKAGTLVVAGATVEIRGRPRYVSRGGDKLAHALAAFRVDPSGATCVDVGASTGGFTDCLLQHGASLVYAMDVGTGQLDARLRRDPRVVVRERRNARDLATEHFPVKPDLGVVDASFISLELLLPGIFAVVGPGPVIALVKPQFEVGRQAVGKGGVVRDPRQHRAVLARISAFARAAGWAVSGITASPLVGPKGNREFFLHLVPATTLDGELPETVEDDLASMIERVVGVGT